MLGRFCSLAARGNIRYVVGGLGLLVVTLLPSPTNIAAPRLPDPKPDPRIEALKVQYAEERRLANPKRDLELSIEFFSITKIIAHLDDLQRRPPSPERDATEKRLRLLIKSDSRSQDLYDIQIYDREGAAKKAKP